MFHVAGVSISIRFYIVSGGIGLLTFQRIYVLSKYKFCNNFTNAFL